MNFHHIALAQEEHTVVFTFMLLNLNNPWLAAPVLKFAAQGPEVNDVQVEGFCSGRVVIGLGDEPNSVLCIKGSSWRLPHVPLVRH